MGYYTELQVKIKLRKDIPENVLGILKTVLIDRYLLHDNDLYRLEHSFFKCERWGMLLLSTNYNDIQGGKMYIEKGYWVVDLHTEFKDYDCEINKFIDWITPFVAGRKKKQYVGWWKGESMNERVNIYIERAEEKLIKNTQ